jgi:hypothetical protein
MHRTLDEVRQEGLQALCDRLGRADMVRFMQQFETGSGDYAYERQKWADEVCIDKIEDAAKNLE